MPVMVPYAQIIIELEKDLEAVREKVRKLSAEQARLETTLETLRKKWPEPTTPATTASSTAVVNQVSGAKRLTDRITIIEAVEIALREISKPARTPDLTRYIIRAGYPYDKDERRLRESISVVVGRNIRNHPVDTKFIKLEDGVYALREWGDFEGGTKDLFDPNETAEGA